MARSRRRAGEPTPAGMTATGEWSHPEHASIARILQETAGLVFPPNRRDSAEAGIERAMVLLGVEDVEVFRRAIAMPGAAVDALIAELTVGETFFFREKGQFDFLRDAVLPQLRETIDAGQPLRIWSAGCATGEEPYSLAMLLREASWRGPASILGTDLASGRLAAARRGRYTRWSMRGVSDDIIDRYFERRGKQFVLRPEIRRAVDFRVLNLVSGDYPSAAPGVQAMDIVFCRNVLIYFDPPSIAAIAQRLLGSLGPSGWLFLGASDPPIAELVPCEVVLTGAGLAYRPARTPDAQRPGVVVDHIGAWAFPTPGAWAADAPALQPLPGDIGGSAARIPLSPPSRGGPAYSPAPIAPLETPFDSHESAYARGDYDAAAGSARVAIDSGEDSEGTWVILVRSLANRGDLRAAGEACAAGIDRHRLSAELAHLHGLLLAQAGRHADASAAARRALYLDPDRAVAHLALGDALLRTGNIQGARRAFINAEALLRDLPPDAAVTGADGARASVLLQIARFHVQRLGSAARAAGA